MEKQIIVRYRIFYITKETIRESMGHQIPQYQNTSSKSSSSEMYLVRIFRCSNPQQSFLFYAVIKESVELQKINFAKR